MLGDKVAGKYELRRLLGSGSMGIVYECVHVDIGKRLAIKLIHPEFGDSVEAVRRFRREARAASTVDSDHIVQIYDFGCDDALGLYMVIEYLEGEDLEARLRRERWIGERDAVTIGVQVARGLAKAHAAGIIHRDLKPANVFLTERDEDGSILAKILDFGVSKLDDRLASTDSIEPALTEHGAILGTPQYMSPEQCEGKLVLDGRTDVWSLAAVLYEMLAGEPAVSDRGGFIAMMMRIVGQDVLPLFDRAPWVPEGVASVIDAGLVRDRERRIPGAPAFAARLLDAYPEAASRRSSPTFISIKTDVSELAPLSPDAVSPWDELTDSDVRRASVDAVALAAQAPPCGPSLHIRFVGTANPVTTRPPPSGETPMTNEDGVGIFVRGEPRAIQRKKGEGD